MPKRLYYSIKRYETRNGLGFRVIPSRDAHLFCGTEVAAGLKGTKAGLSAELKTSLDEAIDNLTTAKSMYPVHTAPFKWGY